MGIANYCYKSRTQQQFPCKRIYNILYQSYQEAYLILHYYDEILHKGVRLGVYSCCINLERGSRSLKELNPINNFTFAFFKILFSCEIRLLCFDVFDWKALCKWLTFAQLWNTVTDKSQNIQFGVFACWLNAFPSISLCLEGKLLVSKLNDCFSELGSRLLVQCNN